MAVSHQDLGNDLRHIILSGRLDIQGTDEIASRFAELATLDARYVIVDFTQVAFLASIGIRALIASAKALHKQGGRMAIVVGNNASVFRTLDAVGIDALVRVFRELDEAKNVLAGKADRVGLGA